MLDQIENDPLALQAIARRLRHLRERLGYTRAKDWCEYIGMGQQSWSNFENARRRISLDEALKLVALTEVSLDWIYLGKHDPGLTFEVPEEVAARPAEGIGLGVRIKAGRKKIGMTGAALASALGVTRQAVNSWEVGTTAPSPELLPEVCRLLGIDEDEVAAAVASEPRRLKLTVQRVLDEARNQIAQISGASYEAIRLKLEITS
ncbi:helix-turn-helix transcriptional regulator [Microvirga terrae]|uniref:Helix-turn-helix transcriptional regulator n=1 Tax=Microvirga terrae TaxID=2740529 RepID=A0ABY5RXT5_9HYPH|nr:helix-turn-helix transcriptional regulator [Microvirga terrae]UVF22110.1 helix-turn-helix transcriptional regulator [Microvirga terrae]